MERLLLVFFGSLFMCSAAVAQGISFTPEEVKVKDSLLQCLQQAVVELDDGISLPDDIAKAVVRSARCHVEFEEFVKTFPITPEERQKTAEDRDEILEGYAVFFVLENRENAERPQ